MPYFAIDRANAFNLRVMDDPWESSQADHPERTRDSIKAKKASISPFQYGVIVVSTFQTPVYEHTCPALCLTILRRRGLVR